jgi:hypothetical protein
MNQQAFQQVSQNSPLAIPTQMRRIEGREWWLWGFAVAVTLALTLGIISFTFPWFNAGSEVSYWFYFSTFTRFINTCNFTVFAGSWRSEISFFNSSVKMPPT